MTREEFDLFMQNNPGRKFCLHNGFVESRQVRPANPKWITNDRAYKILVRYEKLVGINPIVQFDTEWVSNTLSFSNQASSIGVKLFHRMMGFYLESELVRDDSGLR